MPVAKENALWIFGFVGQAWLRGFTRLICLLHVDSLLGGRLGDLGRRLLLARLTVWSLIFLARARAAAASLVLPRDSKPNQLLSFDASF